MREIKFRAWEKLREEHGETYGGEMFYSEEADIKRACGFVIETDSGYSNDDFIWMQYTGLKDKNGKEIYEGDILQTTDGDIGVIEFQSGLFEAHIPNKKGMRLYLWRKGEIIGNKYEHPELLNIKN